MPREALLEALEAPRGSLELQALEAPRKRTLDQLDAREALALEPFGTHKHL